MPIPKPSDKEEKEAFLKRCMSSEVMMSEFPKQAQRFAVCNSSWDNKGKAENSTDADEDKMNLILLAFLERHPELNQTLEISN